MSERKRKKTQIEEEEVNSAASGEENHKNESPQENSGIIFIACIRICNI